LTARKNETFSARIPREDVHAMVSVFPDIEPNGPGGFVLKRGDELYMEIDAELVNVEGDNIEEDLSNPAPEVNCVNFHIPHAFIDAADECLSVAKEIAAKLGWELYDPQSDHIVSDESSGKPWWKFW